MPNLYPGIKPNIGNGRPYVLLFIAVFFPFLLFSQPVITSFTPKSGAVGSTVTINGSNFSTTPAANIVYFGSVPAAVTASTASSLTVTVPAGASYQPITVLTGGLTAFSGAPFNITFSDPGQFTAAAFSTRKDIPTGNGPQSIFSMDMDGDGKTDLVVADGDSNTVEIYRNVSTPGSGTISFALAYDYLLPPGYYPIGITAGDLDGDGKPDMAVTCYGSPKLAVFRNTGTLGTIAMATPAYYSLGNYTTGVIIGDCNGDGKPEIIVASAADNLVSLYANNSTVGSLSFSPKMDLHLPSGTLPFDVVLSDFDGDGRPDIASVNAAANTVSVFRNTGSTGGALSFDLNIDFSVGNGPQDLAVGDLDGDGLPDIAVVNNLDATITLLQNASTPGSMNFNRGNDVPTGTVTSGSPWAIRMADFDGDGKPDIASINQLDNSVSIHRNISTVGDPEIAANVDYATGDVPWALTTADYDGDGLPDLAIVDNTTASITLLRNKSSSETAITAFTPTAGSNGTVVTITGVNFTGATSVSFGSVAATSFTVVSSTSITATVGTGATGNVTVVTPAGTASLGTFTFGVPLPVVGGFSPTSGAPGDIITITGANFTSATRVSFGGVPAASFTIVNDNEITAEIGNGGSGLVGVTAASGTGTLGTFAYLPPALQVSSFSPASGSTGSQIVIRGHGLLNAKSVSFGGVNATSFSINGDTSVIATVGSGATGSVAVADASGNSGSQPGFTYTVNNTPPPNNNITITSFSPSSAGAGDTVYIYGTNLTTANSVTFGGTQALFFKAVSDAQMIAVVGSGSSGYVRVANLNNSDSLNPFTFIYDSTKLSQSGVFQLLQFTGTLNSSDIAQLQWQVRNDAAISSYVVEQSSDSLSYFYVTTVKSTRSNGGAVHTYAYTDPKPSIGATWFRLKMQDTTTAFTYSQSVKLKQVTQAMPVHPNPVKYGFFFVDLPDISVASQLQLVDMSGKVMQVQKVASGVLEVRMNVPNLAAGTYQLQWTNGKQTVYTTILIL